jgi:hypothetical protein
MNTIKRVAIAVAAVLALGISAGAQTYHPGQTIRLSAKFDGPDAARVVCGSANINLRTVSNPNQSNFDTGIGSTCKQVEPGVLELDCKIPDTIASGDYELQAIGVAVSVGTNNQSIGFSYRTPDVPALTFKIENPNTAKKPNLKSVTVLP